MPEVPGLVGLQHGRTVGRSIWVPDVNGGDGTRSFAGLVRSIEFANPELAPWVLLSGGLLLILLTRAGKRLLSADKRAN